MLLLNTNEVIIICSIDPINIFNRYYYEPLYDMIRIKINISNSYKLIALTLTSIIITMTMTSGYNITKDFLYSTYAQSLENETSNSTIGENLLDTNITNMNVTETDIPDVGNLVPNQWVVVLKENATSTPQLASNTVSSLSEEWGDLGINVTSFPEVGMLTIDLNQTLAQEDEAGIAIDASVADVLEEIQNNPNVDYIEPNQIFGIEAQKMPTGIDRNEADKTSTMVGDGQGNVSDVTVAVIDTGIDLDVKSGINNMLDIIDKEVINKKDY